MGRILVPVGRVSPNRMVRGKKVIRMPDNLNRDFHKVDEQGNDIAYTPVDQNLVHNDLFRLSRYDRSPTGVFMPKGSR